MKYSINKCLIELKTIDSRIDKMIQNAIFVGMMKNSSTKEHKTALSENEFNVNVNSTFQSILDLMQRKNSIKQAVVDSNARTMITVAGKEMSVASAIERKKSIELDKMLLNRLKKQYHSTIENLNYKNEDMEDSLEKQITAMLGSDNKNTDASISFSKSYRETNGWRIIDPLKCINIIETLEKDITDFESEIDCEITTSNAITMVEIS